jgi:hypothetical protein
MDIALLILRLCIRASDSLFFKKAKRLFLVSIKYDPSAHESTNVFGMNF